MVFHRWYKNYRINHYVKQLSWRKGQGLSAIKRRLVMIGGPAIPHLVAAIPSDAEAHPNWTVLHAMPSSATPTIVKSIMERGDPLLSNKAVLRLLEKCRPQECSSADLIALVRCLEKNFSLCVSSTSGFSAVDQFARVLKVLDRLTQGNDDPEVQDAISRARAQIQQEMEVHHSQEQKHESKVNQANRVRELQQQVGEQSYRETMQWENWVKPHRVWKMGVEKRPPEP